MTITRSATLWFVLLAAAGCNGGSDATSEESGTNAESLSLAPIGTGSVFAPLPPAPGYPEGIVLVGDRVYVSGPATFGTAGRGPSQILAFDRATGAARGAITVAGEALAAEHALSCITSDGEGRLYALSTQLGVLRFTARRDGSFAQETYAAPFPDLPACGPGVQAPCSPTGWDGPPLLNDLAFDEEGDLYVTDSFQATVFRVRRGGGAPEVFFQSAHLAGPPGNIGLNGLRVGPLDGALYVTVTFAADAGGAGMLYAVPRRAPSDATLRLVHQYSASDGPDGLAFDLLGRPYVVLAGASSLSVLDREGRELRRFAGPTGSAIPFDTPANVAFDQRGSALVTNHASFSNDATHFAVLRVSVGDLGFPLARPFVP